MELSLKKPEPNWRRQHVPATLVLAPESQRRRGPLVLPSAQALLQLVSEERA
jgi:hypothetical protein